MSSIWGLFRPLSEPALFSTITTRTVHLLHSGRSSKFRLPAQQYGALTMRGRSRSFGNGARDGDIRKFPCRTIRSLRLTARRPASEHLDSYRTPQRFAGSPSSGALPADAGCRIILRASAKGSPVSSPQNRKSGKTGKPQPDRIHCNRLPARNGDIKKFPRTAFGRGYLSASIPGYTKPGPKEGDRLKTRKPTEIRPNH